MKNKLLLITLISLLFGASAFAQRQKGSQKFLAEFEWNFVGDYNYQFINQNGQEVFDGPFTMKATLNDRKVPYSYYHTADITGNYNLAGSHLNGKLHGPLTMNATLNVVVTNGQRQNNTYSFKGNFKNGYPDGNFIVNYPSYGIMVNVNYKNGVLVGAYSVKGKDSDGFVSTITGSLTSDGQLTGNWKFVTGDGTEQMSFSNGVVTNRPSYDADLRAKAKAFAAGTITEEQLLKQNIRVGYGEVEIGKKPSRFILHGGINYEKLGWYSFNKPTAVEYRYLIKMTTLSDEGIAVLKSVITDPMKVQEYLGTVYTADPELEPFLKEYDFRNEFYGRVMYDKRSGLYYSRIGSSMPLAKYCTGNPDWSDYQEDIYFTKEQFAELQKVLYDARMSKIDSVPLKEYIERYYLKVSNFYPCHCNKNVVGCNVNGYIYYFNCDKYEDYFINKGMGSEVLNNSAEERKDIVREKIRLYKKAYEEKISKEYQSAADKYLTTNILNKTHSELYSRNMVCSKQFFPIVSFKADGNVYYDSSNKRYVAPYLFTVPTRLNTDLFTTLGLKPHATYTKGGYKTYKVIVNFIGKSESVDKNETFNDNNFVQVASLYDTLAIVEAEIIKNHKVLVANYASTLTGVRDNYYLNYMITSPWVVNHNNVQATIAERKEILSIQSNVATYIEKYGQILKSDASLQTACAKYKDLASAYKSYCSARDLKWTSTYDLTKLDQYICDQDALIKFIELRDQIAENNESLTVQKSSNPKAFKAYQVSYKASDLSWEPNKGTTELEKVISMQQECFAAYQEKVVTSTEVKKTTEPKEEKPKEEKPEKVKSEEVKPEELKPEKVKTEKVKAEKIKPTYVEKGLVNSFEFSYNPQLASQRFVPLENVGHQSFSNVNPIEFNYLIGYRFNKWVSLSFGTGLVCDMMNLNNQEYPIIYETSYSPVRLPLFVNAKAFMMDTKVQPMASVSLGGSTHFDFKSWSMIADLGIGCNFKMGNRGNLYFLAGAKLMPMPNFTTYGVSEIPGEGYFEGFYTPENTVALSLKVGFMF